MNKNVIIIIGLLACVLIISHGVLADTGTYEIYSQRSDLTVLNTTDVIIEYNVQFHVTGGNIPWVAMGLPNENFNVQSYGGAASNCYSQNSYGWSGVHCDLDKTYYPGDTFNYSFKIIQHGFVYKYGDNASIQFTPNWWDNAVTDDLTVAVWIPADINNVSTASEPTRYENNSVVWEWNNVGNGQKESIGVIMPLSAFPNLASQPTGTQPTGPSTTTPSSGTIWDLISQYWWILIIIAFGYFLLKESGYEGPSFSLSGDSESKRHMNMNCPNDKTPLDKRTIKDVTVDFCDKCGGCFFDKGEIESLIKANVDEKDLNTNNKTFTQPVNHQTKCPRCEESMHKKSKAVDGKKAVMHVCSGCNGIWLDRGNYQIIKDKRLAQEKEQKKHKEEDDKWFPYYWWFFYPYIGSTGYYSHACYIYQGGRSGGAGASGGYSGGGGCACVSCACVSACACACACAGGSGAGCTDKNRISQMRL